MIPTTWIFVFVTEGIYICVTFIRRFSHLPIVEKGVGYHFFFVNCAQLGWIVSYCVDVIWLANLWMTLVVIFLVWLNYRLYYQDHIDATPRFLRQDDNNNESSNDRDTRVLRDEYGQEISINVFNEYLLFRFPFQLHLAWGMFLMLMGLNELVLALNSSAKSQIALLSIVILWLIGKFSVLFEIAFAVLPINIHFVYEREVMNYGVFDPKISCFFLFCLFFSRLCFIHISTIHIIHHSIRIICIILSPLSSLYNPTCHFLVHSRCLGCIAKST